MNYCKGCFPLESVLTSFCCSTCSYARSTKEGALCNKTSEGVCARPSVPRRSLAARARKDARFAAMSSSTARARMWRTSPSRERSFPAARRLSLRTTSSFSCRTLIVAIAFAPIVCCPDRLPSIRYHTVATHSSGRSSSDFTVPAGPDQPLLLT